MSYGPWDQKDTGTTERLILLLSKTFTLFLVFWCHSYKGFPSSSADKESACDAGETSSIPGLGRSAGEGICWSRLPTPVFLGLPCGSAGKESTCNNKNKNNFKKTNK